MAERRQPSGGADRGSGRGGNVPRGGSTGGSQNRQGGRPSGGNSGRSDRPVRQDGNSSGRPDRPSSQDRPIRSDRPDRPARPIRRAGEASGPSDRPVRGGADRADRPDRRPDRSDRPERPRAERTERRPTDRDRAGSGQPDRQQRTDSSRRPERVFNDRPRVAVPELPDEAQIEVLDSAVREAVERLGGVIAHYVGRHLAAAGLFLAEDPVRALAHARAAREKAPRLAEAREIVGISAYAAGDYALARAELRAARRITGNADLLPMLADCERGLGHPERALTVAADPDARRLRGEDRLELAIVVAGARRDLGEPEAAVQVLTLPALHDDTPSPTTIRLWYAYADALEAAGRFDEAADYFARTVRADDEEMTDALERLDALGGRS